MLKNSFHLFRPASGNDQTGRLHLPLLEDLKARKALLGSFLRKLLVFIALFIFADQVVGELLEIGLNRYYGLDVPARILCVGHSSTVLGIDKVKLQKELKSPIAKYARQGADASNRFEMIRHYLSVHPKSVTTIIYDVSAHSFSEQGLSANSHLLFYPFIGTEVVRDYLKMNRASPTEYWTRRFLKLPRYDEVTLSHAMRGWLKKWSNLKYGQVDIEQVKKLAHQGKLRKIAFDPGPLALIDDTIRFIRSHDIRLILVYIPTIDILNGAEPLSYRKAVGVFEEYASHDNGITFLNYNPYYSHRHELFYDTLHLNEKGQRIFTEHFAKDLNNILQLEDETQ
jgi:hypothetical protein